MSDDQFTTIGAKRQRSLTKIVKKHKKKELLTDKHVYFMRDTPLNPETFQRHARQYYVTHMIGSRLTLSHPYTDVHGRYLKTVLLDFSLFKNTGYVHVQPFQPVKENEFGVTAVNYNMALHVRSHRDLYKKLLEHKLL
ncbi:hypothetical protein EZV76_15865 [Flagellimonas alvinocaridis]|uniref:Uncharacterized protein n=1 Tax=Flagellimonas alvinocaridis TaxID=2530200 RepID=A0A4S8RHT5_9FLAO|nr:hypothetical protein [Allomuricauda alvinocaridis]THV57092.1 hypothetical protein EZV76_15865 [Allomuricauda alvinocaridis]